jgi:hypothetical protein
MILYNIITSIGACDELGGVSEGMIRSDYQHPTHPTWMLMYCDEWSTNIGFEMMTIGRQTRRFTVPHGGRASYQDL